jgi:hypothetical protein
MARKVHQPDAEKERVSRAMAISVLLPYRNAAATLDEALASTLGDLGPSDEVVAIDDASSDDGPRLIAERARQDGRIVTVSASGEGIAAALVRGFAFARHGLVARMDADDVTLPGRFAACRAALEADATLAAVGTQVEGFPAPTPGMDRYLGWQNALVTPEDHARAIFVESPLCNPSVLMRRDALTDVGAYRDAAWPEDWDLFLRLDAAGYRLAKVPRVLLRWRRHGGANTVRDPRCAPARLRAARAHFLAPRLLARGAPFAVWGAGQTGRRLARALASEGARAAFFVDIDPRKIGRRAQDAPVLAPDDALAAVRAQRACLVVAVGDRGARAVVQGRLAGAGLVEGADFVCAA